MSVALRGLRLSMSSWVMGTEPTAAALCRGNCPRLSLIRVEALWAINLRAVSKLFLDAQKCRAVCEYTINQILPSFMGKSHHYLTTKIYICFFSQSLLFHRVSQKTFIQNLLLLALTSAPLLRNKSTSSSASLRLDAIINGVQPDPSYVQNPV